MRWVWVGLLLCAGQAAYAQALWPPLRFGQNHTPRPSFEPVSSVRVEVRVDGWTLYAPDRPRTYPAMSMPQVADFLKTPAFRELQVLGRQLHINPSHLTTARIDADPLLPYSSIAPVLKVLREATLHTVSAVVGDRDLQFIATRRTCERDEPQTGVNDIEFGPLTEGMATIVDLFEMATGFEGPCHGLTIWLAPMGAWAQWDERWEHDDSTSTCDGPINPASARVLAMEESGEAPFTTLPLAVSPVPVGEKCDVALVAMLPDVRWGAVTEALAFVQTTREGWPGAYIRTRRPGATK